MDCCKTVQLDKNKLNERGWEWHLLLKWFLSSLCGDRLGHLSHFFDHLSKLRSSKTFPFIHICLSFSISIPKVGVPLIVSFSFYLSTCTYNYQSLAKYLTILMGNSIVTNLVSFHIFEIQNGWKFIFNRFFFFFVKKEFLKSNLTTMWHFAVKIKCHFLFLSTITDPIFKEFVHLTKNIQYWMFDIIIIALIDITLRITADVLWWIAP